MYSDQQVCIMRKMSLMDVEIISKETIKPCFPTPENLRKYKLCSLDHTIFPGVYIQFLLFYPNKTTTNVDDQRIVSLKKSLSETLTHFPPLAGTIQDDFYVDCDDRGASFTTAKIKSSYGSLTEFLSLENPDLKLITELFLPLSGNFHNNNDNKNSHLIYVQATIFEKCGGIVLGACVSHKFMDAAALSFFLTSWADINAAAAKNTYSSNVISPDLSTASSMFPIRDNLQIIKEAPWAPLRSILQKEGRSITQRFVFDGSAIAALKAKAGIDPCTRVEAVSAFIWKHALMAANGERRHQDKNNIKSSVLSHSVNLRRKDSQNFSPGSLGNLAWSARAKLTAEERNINPSFPHLVGKIRKSLLEIDWEYVNRMVGDQGTSAMIEHVKELSNVVYGGDGDYYGFSSWCKLGFYEMDFGWGKPIWMSYKAVDVPIPANYAFLFDTEGEDGVEAWLTFDERCIAVLESNQEFREFAELNPSPLRNSRD